MGGMETSRARKLGLAFFFHDIGKIEIDPDIIQKPGPPDPPGVGGDEKGILSWG